MENPSPQKGEAAAKAKTKTKTKVLVYSPIHGEVDLHRRKEEKAVEAKGRTKAKLEAAQSREEATMTFIPLPTRVKPIEEDLHQERPTSRFADLGLEGPATKVNHAISATLECASIT